MAGPDRTVVEVLREYPEGRVLRMSDGAIAAEGVYDDGPITGRATFVATADPKPGGLNPAEMGLRTGRKLVYRERKPWEAHPPKPKRRDIVHEEEMARRAAFDQLGKDEPKRERPEPEPDPGPTVEQVVLHEARKQAGVVMAKWNSGV